MTVDAYCAGEIDSCQYLSHTGDVTTVANIQDRAAPLPLADTCCAPLLREPITASQAAGYGKLQRSAARRDTRTLHSDVGYVQP